MADSPSFIGLPLYGIPLLAEPFQNAATLPTEVDGPSFVGVPFYGLPLAGIPFSRHQSDPITNDLKPISVTPFSLPNVGLPFLSLGVFNSSSSEEGGGGGGSNPGITSFIGIPFLGLPFFGLPLFALPLVGGSGGGGGDEGGTTGSIAFIGLPSFGLPFFGLPIYALPLVGVEGGDSGGEEGGGGEIETIQFVAIPFVALPFFGLPVFALPLVGAINDGGGNQPGTGQIVFIAIPFYALPFYGLPKYALPFIGSGFQSTYYFLWEITSGITDANLYQTLSTQYGTIYDMLQEASIQINNALLYIAGISNPEAKVDLMQPIQNSNRANAQQSLSTLYPAVQALNQHAIETGKVSNINEYLEITGIKVVQGWADLCARTNVIIDPVHVDSSTVPVTS